MSSWVDPIFSPGIACTYSQVNSGDGKGKLGTVDRAELRDKFLEKNASHAFVLRHTAVFLLESSLVALLLIA